MQLALRESDYTRLRRVKLRESSFELLKRIGRGAFGEVWLVQLKGLQQQLCFAIVCDLCVYVCIYMCVCVSVCVCVVCFDLIFICFVLFSMNLNKLSN